MTPPADLVPIGEPCEGEWEETWDEGWDDELADDRMVINVGWEPQRIITLSLAALVSVFDATVLFRYGGRLVELVGDRVVPLARPRLERYLAHAVAFVKVDNNGRATPTWPNTRVLAAVQASPEGFTCLDRVMRLPFVRPDGTVCTEPGYDRSTRCLLVLEPELQGIKVPHKPTREQQQQAVQLLTGQWLGDMPLQEQADVTNLFALVLTPFIRHLVPLVPLAVVDGLAPGVGKNLLADCLSRLVTGVDCDPLPYSRDEAEMRRLITARISVGESLFVFDEAHVIAGANLARTITAPVYTDRLLGSSRTVQCPNLVTWVALGNQVQVLGDMARRVYRISLRPTQADPDRRGGFDKPDLRGWTQKHRRALVEAALTLIRAWYTDGQPPAPVTETFGSFEQWQQLLGSILAHAGLRDFLGNTAGWRTNIDFTTTYWQEHLQAVSRQFPAGTRFTVAQVVQGLRDNSLPECPPELYDCSKREYPRLLGQAYFRVKERWFGPVRLVCDGQPGKGGAHRSVAAWKIEIQPAAPGASEGPEGPTTHPGDFR